MKTKSSLLLILPVLLGLTASAWAAGAKSGRGAGAAGPVCAQSTAPLALDETTRQALLQQIEEERMAVKLYHEFAQKWDVQQFKHIAKAEKKHTEALRQLATRAGLEPAKTEPDKFANATIQQRYAELKARGLTSVAEARQALIALEEQDIADLKALSAKTTQSDVQAVLAKLTKASERHLQALQNPGQGEGKAAAKHGQHRHHGQKAAQPATEPTPTPTNS